jgi:hypothetical protein
MKQNTGTTESSRSEELLLFLGAAPLLFLGLLYSSCCLLFAVGGSLDTACAVPGLLCGAAGMTFLILHKSAQSSFPLLSLKARLMLFLCSTLALFCAFLFSARILDLSYDGQTYHLEALRLFADGWNYFSPPPIPEYRSEMRYYSILLAHYPAFVWLSEAIFFRAFGNFEAAKGLHFICLWPAFCVTAALLLRLRFRLVPALLLAAVAALNPVSLTQSLTLYVDGIFASLVCAFLSLFFLLLFSADAASTAAFISATVILFNIKFTATAVGSVLGAAFGFVLILDNKRNGKHLFSFPFAPFAASLLFAVAGAGFHPYATNYFETGNLFYPVPGSSAAGVVKDDVTFQQSQLPANFHGRNRFDKLFRSVFSRSENAYDRIPARLKIPGSVAAEEFSVFHLPDVRVGGFGPLFGLALLLSCCSLIADCLRHPRSAAALLALPLLLFVSVIINPECWWARYAPQLWLIPITVAVSRFRQFGAVSRVDMSVIALLLINAGGAAFSSYTQAVRDSDALSAQLQTLRQEDSPLKVSFQRFRANELRLKGYGVRYEEEDRPSCSAPRFLLASPTTLCPAPPEHHDAGEPSKEKGGQALLDK